jgi:hypothetical protein
MFSHTMDRTDPPPPMYSGLAASVLNDAEHKPDQMNNMTHSPFLNGMNGMNMTGIDSNPSTPNFRAMLPATPWSGSSAYGGLHGSGGSSGALMDISAYTASPLRTNNNMPSFSHPYLTTTTTAATATATTAAAASSSTGSSMVDVVDSTAPPAMSHQSEAIENLLELPHAPPHEHQRSLTAQ